MLTSHLSNPKWHFYVYVVWCGLVRRECEEKGGGSERKEEKREKRQKKKDRPEISTAGRWLVFCRLTVSGSALMPK